MLETPEVSKVTIGTLFDELLAEYRRKEIKGFHHVDLRLAEGNPPS